MQSLKHQLEITKYREQTAWSDATKMIAFSGHYVIPVTKTRKLVDNFDISDCLPIAKEA